MASKYSKCSQISISKRSVLFWNQESGPRADLESLEIIVLFISLSSRIRKWSLGWPSSGKKGKHKGLRKEWEQPRLSEDAWNFSEGECDLEVQRWKLTLSSISCFCQCFITEGSKDTCLTLSRNKPFTLVVPCHLFDHTNEKNSASTGLCHRKRTANVWWTSTGTNEGINEIRSNIIAWKCGFRLKKPAEEKALGELHKQAPNKLNLDGWVNRILGKNWEKGVSGRRKHIFLFLQLNTVWPPGLAFGYLPNTHRKQTLIYSFAADFGAVLFRSDFRMSAAKVVLVHLRARVFCQRKRRHKARWKSAKWLERGLMLCKCK